MHVCQRIGADLKIGLVAEAVPWLRAILVCLIAVLAPLMTGCDSKPVLVVDLMTDFHPAVEFDRVEVNVFVGAALGAVPEDSKTLSDVPLSADTRGGLRAAEFEGLPRGTFLVQGRLMLGDAEVASSQVLVDIGTDSLAVTLRVTRDCVEVSCPGDGSPDQTVCLAGRCVDPRCSPESPEFCPAPECGTDSECSVAMSLPACAAGLCLAGVCATGLDDDACPTDNVCTIDRGCVALVVPGGGSSDAGIADGGDPAALSNDIVELSIGSLHACARRGTGEVVCWGTNIRGSLGDGTIESSLVPVTVTGLNDAVELSSAGAGGHTCARRATGQVVCWGPGEGGALGDGRGVDSAVPVQVVGLDDAMQLGTGGGNTCARRATGGVSCWGINTVGALGDGTQTNRLVPVPVSGLVDVLDIASGMSHSCVRQPTRIACWGANNRGQLGAGTRIDALVPEATQFSLSGALMLTAGDSHTCVVGNDGNRVCFGDNAIGALGDGTLAPLLAVDSDGLRNIVLMAAGDAHTCALLGDGSVTCTGYNFDGEFGSATETAQSITFTVPGLSGVVELKAGGRLTCARQADGQILCWGAGTQGQFGEASLVNHVEPFALPFLRGFVAP